MDNMGLKERCIDIVFCIDGTGSMSDCIESVKRSAKEFYQLLLEEMTARGSKLDQVRVKVIVFRDYETDGANSMCISDFFTLDQDLADYEAFLASVRAEGGGDGPENGLEALFYAMQSNFEKGDDDRQIIVLFSDADALPLKTRAACPGYPEDMVDEDGLKKIWRGLDQTRSTSLNQFTKRLVIFAPVGTKYEEISNDYNLSWYKAVNPDNGLKDITFDDIISLIGKSATAKARK